MHILALDIGERRTGVAFADTASGIPLPLPTIHHRSSAELADALRALIVLRRIESIVIGLPLLPDGSEGAQAAFVRTAVSSLAIPQSISVSFLDERFTTPRAKSSDPDAEAACEILSTHLARISI